MEENTNTGEQRALEDLSIQELRKLAVSYQIKASRDWSTEDFIEAINTRRRRHNGIANVVFDTNTGPGPGWARVRIHNTETGSNHPVPVRVNNYQAFIPRDVEVDIPLEALESLRNSKTPVRVKDPTGRLNHEGKPALVWKEVPSYPFEVIAMTPGQAKRNGVPVVRPSSNREKHKLKLKFREIYERWPRREELRKFQDLHMQAKASKTFEEAAEDLSDPKE